MSCSPGNEDEMGIKDHGLSIEEADDLLAGDIPAGRDDLGALATDLASLSVTYRHEVDAVDLGRWAAQAAGIRATEGRQDRSHAEATLVAEPFVHFGAGIGVSDGYLQCFRVHLFRVGNRFLDRLVRLAGQADDEIGVDFDADFLAVFDEL